MRKKLLAPSLLVVLTTVLFGASSFDELPPLIHSDPGAATQLHLQDELTLNPAPTAGLNTNSIAYEEESSFLSEIYEANHSFGLLGLNWSQELPEETLANIEIRFRYKAGDWSDWQYLHADQDGSREALVDPDHQSNAINQGVFSYLTMPESEAFQYRATLSTSDSTVTPKLSDMSFDYVDGGKPSLLDSAKQSLKNSYESIVVENVQSLFGEELGMNKLIFQRGLDVVSREEWGAVESYRYFENFEWLLNDDDDDEEEEEAEDDGDDSELGPPPEIIESVYEYEGNDLWWPQGYTGEVEKIIIHHTATDVSDGNYEQDVRDIYYYHTLSRAWGDVGYNYLIAPDGTIYEGRAGGEGVVAGHAYGYNRSTIGIALLGNYQGQELPAAMLESLLKLVYDKADLYDIEIDGEDEYREVVTPNLLGHRDVASTACPGEHSYDYLGDIRTLVGAVLDTSNKNSSSKWAYEETTNREIVSMIPGDSKGIMIKIENTGSKTWSKDTFLTVEADADAETLANFEKDSDKAVAYMKETSVAPGETATFNFIVSATDYKDGGIGLFNAVPVFNGEEKSEYEMQIAVILEALSFDFDVVDIDSPSTLEQGETATVTVELRNTGTMKWKNEGDYEVTLRRVGTSDLSSDWNLATLNESTVRTGGTGTFTFEIEAGGLGSEGLIFRLQSAEQALFSDSSSSFYVRVGEEEDESSSLSTTSDADWLIDHSSLEFAAGETKRIWVQLQNTTGGQWNFNEGTELVIQTPSGVEIGEVTAVPARVFPNAKPKLYFDVTAPTNEDTYTLEFRLREDGQNITTQSYSLDMQVGAVTAYTTSDYEEAIRVRLTPDQALTTTILSADEDFSLYEGSTLLKTFPANTRVTLRPGSTTIAISSGTYRWSTTDTVRLIPDDGGIIEVHTMEQLAYDGETNDNLFRGAIEMQLVPSEFDSDGEANWSSDLEPALINELPLVEYMKGVAEQSNSMPEEKIKAVMLAAQNYALFYMGDDAIEGASWPDVAKFPGMPYHIDDDPNSSQKYLGYGFEKRGTTVVDAYEDVQDLVITYDGEIVKTPYFSQSDGESTKSAYDVWGWNHTPYLIEVDDSHCDSSGSFYGHGVGMSGCGAEAMADDGASFEEILEHYYTGVEIVERDEL